MTPAGSLPKRVAVALSGGVDSAVVAALLKEQGADIVGLTMRMQPDDKTDDAARVAQTLGIAHHVVDVTELFSNCVIQDFLQTYARGETPVPCAVCNRRLKFGALMEIACGHGAQALVTGHYAQRIETPDGPQLHMAADAGKDQSYFLFSLTATQLDFLRFPLGGLTKAETRALAARYALPVAQKKDSQDICFVPDGDYVGVLKKLNPEAIRTGDIVDQFGRVLGQHGGIVHFTVGQRKGLNLSDRIGDHNEPLFVLRLDAANNRVIVGPRAALARQEVFLRDMNWLASDVEVPSMPQAATADAPQGLPVTVRLRSSQKPLPARFFMDPAGGGAGLVRLDEPAYSVAPGQAGVIYQGTRLLGGGWICSGDFARASAKA